MTVRRGEGWGTNGPLPADGVVVRSDAEARAVVEAARRAGEEPPALGLLGGDLCRTLGGSGDEARLHTEEATRAVVDLGCVLVDGRQFWFLAQLVARRSWWRGPLVVAANAQWLGRWDVAPRSHPGDGKLDVVVADLSLRDRTKAWRRLPQGSHVPHPGITERQLAATQLDLDPPCPVWLDGVRVATRARALSVRVEPDAVAVVV